MAEQRGQNSTVQINAKNNDLINGRRNVAEVRKLTSLSTLILWNISKALEKNPAIDIKSAIKTAQALLDRERDVSAMIPDSAEQRHLACAVLAWQQLGHSDADSLCQFIANKTNDRESISAASNDRTPVEASVISSRESKYSKGVDSTCFGSSTIGPVVKLPVETKIVMRMENSASVRQTVKLPKAQDRDTMNKIEAACCIDSACAERLAKMDTATTDLRMRAGMLAKREAERVELLERAEAAWKDLELGYQRRLSLAEEKEEDFTKQMTKIIDERNGYKDACTSLAMQLRQKGDKAEKDRTALSQVEKDVCERACLRLKLSEESAQSDAILAEHQCRASQLDRDLQFKEEQARRKLLNFKSELESSQTITHETERAMRAELCSLREQISEVSEQLLGEDTEISRIKEELEELRQEKMGMVEDLEGCKAMCDTRMQGKIDELKKKRTKLAELKDIVTECRCKQPVDVTVEVKRTASLAALCKCTPEEKILESCSCTSLRGRLLSNLLADLFSGLQSEMGGTGTQMPCQLLKCLEDRHNWDRASIVKTNLKNYFAQLLIGELDIAIATSIEKYHAKWVGQSCADTARMIPDPGEAENEGWQERAIERRAQKLATKLAEQLFQERADQLTQRAKDIVSSGPPPCECKPQQACGKGAAAVYPVLVKPISPAPVNGPTTPANTPAYWRQTMQDVTQLRVQIENLKKDSLKKEDLKLMEEKITKIVQRGSGTGKTEIRSDILNISSTANDTVIKKEQKNNRAVNSNQSNYYMNLNKLNSLKKKQIEPNSSYKRGLKSNIVHYNASDKTFKPYKKHGQTYAVNMCMCSQKEPNKIALRNKIPNGSVTEENKEGCCRKDKASKDLIPQITSSVKQTKPINSSLQDTSTRNNSMSFGQYSCQSNCKCFHKIPSNTSIDKLLETLAKWKSDLNPLETKECKNEIPCCNFLPGREISEFLKKTLPQDDTNLPVCCKKDAENKITCITPLNTNSKENKIPNIKEESVKISKISSRSSAFVEISEDKKSNYFGDKRTLINSQTFTKTSNELDTEKKLTSNGRDITAISPNSCSSRKNQEKNNLNRGVCCDSSFIAPTTTESEYMGAINLEKSNEDFCKCVNNRNEIASDSPNEPFQCIPCKCSCNSSETKNNLIQVSNGTEELLCAIKTCGSKQQGKEKKKYVNDTQVPRVMKKLPSKSDESNIKEIFPCDCGYDIQFLGVTLTDVKSTNQTEVFRDRKESQLEEKCEIGRNGSNSAKTTRSLSSDGMENNKHKASIRELNNHKNNEKEENKNSAVTKIKQEASIQEKDNNRNTNDELKVLNINHMGCEKCAVELKKQASIREINITKNITYETKDVNKDKRINNGNNEKSCKNTLSCDCKVNYDGFKNYIEVAFQNQQTNEDKGLDVQSFKGSKNEKESCVCCNKQNLDESEDLEKNTFHLLEEHLKKKLEEFKELSCNSTCIPPEEEEKLFNTILKRVKQVIIDSTNKITCKCSNEEENSKGSWNRAYGLLQEYLKTKIKRVQCSCVLAEDNNDTVLPEVLDKVCNLIEQDFQRLKDVCGCKKSELQDKDSKQVNFREQIPERDRDSFNIENNVIYKTINSCISQNPQTSVIIKENISSQVPAYLGMETKSCNPLETYTKNVQTLENAPDNLKSTDCNCCERKVDAELLGTKKSNKSISSKSSNVNNENKMKPAQFSNIPYVAYASECVCKNTECTEYSVSGNNNPSILNDALRKPILGENDYQKATPVTYNKPIQNSIFVETKTGVLNPNEETEAPTNTHLCCSYIEKNKDINSVKSVCKCNPTDSSTCCQKNENLKKREYKKRIKKTNDGNRETLAHFPNKPYIGYTIDCSCDIALGPCVCTKSILEADNDLMGDIMKKSMPNDKYYEKVSYIMKSNPTENTNYHNDFLSEMTGDLYLHNVLKHKTLYEDDSKQDDETEASLYDNEDIILKNSREFFEIAHTTTNTFDDNVSLDTDYSNNEAPLDWCECCSQLPIREMNSDRLKQSIYFPIPLGNDKHLESDNKTSNSESVQKTIPKYCDCDLVPICHVKMLVENIENKLVTAKCTCDSMIPKVCPIHSTGL